MRQQRSAAIEDQLAESEAELAKAEMLDDFVITRCASLNMTISQRHDRLTPPSAIILPGWPGDAPQTLLRSSAFMRIAIPLMLLAASVCLALGLVLPLILYGAALFLHPGTVALRDRPGVLWTDGEWLLAGCWSGLFSIIFPLPQARPCCTSCHMAPRP